MGTHTSIGVMAAALTVFIWVVPAPARGPHPFPGKPFEPGETLTYDVSWSVFQAGQVNVTLQRAEGRTPEAFEVVTTARSQGFVSLVYNVQNEFHSFFDPSTVCSIEIRKKVNEGRRHKDTRIVFDLERRLAILDETDPTRPDAPPKHAENEIPDCVADVVTAFYATRRRALRVGESFLLPINDGAKTYDVTVEVQARDQIQTPLGLRSTLRVEPKVFGGLYKRKGRMLIWFSDDEQRLPLRIKASVAVGTITGTLRTVSNGSVPDSFGR
jgi:hypothetical protein